MNKFFFDFYPELKQLIPYDKEFFTKRFVKTFKYSRTLSFSSKSNIKDYENFKILIYQNIGKKFFPVLRISDGELLLTVGSQNESRRANYLIRLNVFFKNLIKKLINYDNFVVVSHIYGKFNHKSGTSETYNFEKKKISKIKVKEIRDKFLDEFNNISNKGLVAVHFSYSEKYSLAEKYWLNFLKILKRKNIILNEENCFPFYFVYMLLSEKNELRNMVSQKKILCVSSATGEKKTNIMNYLSSFQPRSIDWLAIPSSETFFYNFPNKNDHNKSFDLIFLAAGTGKTNIIKQLETYQCPVIDCGYYFEVWNNNKLKYNRVGCVIDDEY